MKQYEIKWGSGYTHKDNKIVSENEINEDNGWTNQSIHQIKMLNVGDSTDCSDLSGEVWVTRIKDKLSMSHITKIETWNTGGGCMVVILTLPNGKVLCISDEYVGLYNSANDMFEDDGMKCLNGFWINESIKKEA